MPEPIRLGVRIVDLPHGQPAPFATILEVFDLDSGRPIGEVTAVIVTQHKGA